MSAKTDPWNGQAGELTWSIAAAIIAELDDGEAHERSTVTSGVVQRLDANPATVKSIVDALARFGVIDRPRTNRLRITTLGAAWWNER